MTTDLRFTFNTASHAVYWRMLFHIARAFDIPFDDLKRIWYDRQLRQKSLFETRYA